MNLNNKLVLVTGASGFVGKNLVQRLKDNYTCKLLTPSHTECDFAKEESVSSYFEENKPEVVLHIAGKVGGILANKNYPAEFFYQNAMMSILISHYSWLNGTEKLVTLAAGCGYPKHLEVPYTESDFWNGFPDENSYAYSLAKKNLIVQSWAYREQYDFNSTVLLPANLYGPHDNFNLESSHVVPALIRKFIEARDKGKNEVVVWGDGTASREFLYVDDTTEAIIKMAESCNESGPFNLGTGVETSIKELIETIRDYVGYEGNVVWDTSKPNGQPRRFYDMSEFKRVVGYVPSTSLSVGIDKTVKWYEENYSVART
jgi:GDP-L-fucose synthase